MKHSLSLLLSLTALTRFAGVVHYDVPPMSDQMRLPDAEPYKVKELGEKYLSRFLNIRYAVAQLRARYLKETL